jgi:AraC family transcriptional activator of pobA
MAIEIKDKLLPQNYIKVVPFDPTKNITRPHKHNGYLELVLLIRHRSIHYSIFAIEKTYTHKR